MHDKPVSLIAMDMDGTLLDSRQRLTPGNLAALRKAQAAGIHLAICSGRLPGDVAMFLDRSRPARLCHPCRSMEPIA